MSGRLTVWKYYFIVFVASACTLIIELVAGRIMAPFIGVSLYTWTSIIGVVLAGISLGNYLGGRIADRAPRAQTLGVLFLLSGLSSLSILALIGFAGGKTVNLPVPLMVRITLLTALVFFMPSLLLGTISPVVVKLTLKDLRATGSIVGKIYAWSTVGSIVGTFMTGYVLISSFGTRMIIAGVSVVLIAMAILFGELWKRERVVAAATLLVFLGFGYYLNTKDAFASPYWKESNYYSIRFYDQGDGEGSSGNDSRIRALVLDHLVHSFSSLTDPTRLDYGYERVYADIAEYMSLSRSTMDTLFIGGGGYTFPRFMEYVYPYGKYEVIEIDPEVTRAAYEELGLSRDTKVVTYNMDGRIFFNNGSAIKDKYDLILGDAFNDLSIPYHLTTLEFNEKLRDSLKPNGFFLANIIDNPKRGDFMRPYINTLKRVFPHVTVAAIGFGWEASSQNTLIVVASMEPFDPKEFTAKLAAKTGKEPSSRVMSEEDLVEYMKSGTGLVLTDDHAPVDQLIAKLFDERGF